jgi:hypothetical protein
MQTPSSGKSTRAVPVGTTTFLFVLVAALFVIALT